MERDQGLAGHRQSTVSIMYEVVCRIIMELTMHGVHDIYLWKE